MRQAKQARNAIARGERARDDDGDAAEQDRTGGRKRARAQRGAQQHDSELQQELATELHARIPALRRRPEAAHKRAGQNGQDERLESRAPKEMFFDRLRAIRDSGDGGAERDAGDHESGLFHEPDHGGSFRAGVS